MTTKLALIVDDSKTAQLHLKRLLEKFSIAIEVAFSAEQALTMLPSLSVDIIFMDHNMDGMDGLAALKIIKNNPETAMIPVIMYTSQANEVYVSQARALGALDTLSKDTFKSSSLDRLMSRLGISERENSSTASSESHPEPTPTEHGDAHPTEESEPTQHRSSPELQQVLADIEEQNSDSEGSHHQHPGAETLKDALIGIRRLLGVQAKQIAELQHKFDLASLNHVTVNDMPLSIWASEAQKERDSMRLRTTILLCLSFVVIVLLVVAIAQASQRYKHLNQAILSTDIPSVTIIEAKPVEPSADTKSRPEPTLKPEQSNSSPEPLNQSNLLNTLTWLSTIDMQYPYASEPLAQARVDQIQALVDRLGQSGFSGTLRVNIHFGDFCVKPASNATAWELSNVQTPVSECTFYKRVKPESVPESYISIPFIQFEESSIPLLDGEINVEVRLAGFSEIAASYPALEDVQSVSEWNTIAAKNNRLSFELIQNSAQ